MITPRVPRRFPIGDGEETVLVPRIPPAAPPSVPPAGKSPEVEESSELSAGAPPASQDMTPPSPVRRPAPPAPEAGARAAEDTTSPVRRPAPLGEGPAGPFRSGGAAGPQGPGRPGLGSRLLLRIGDIPIKVVYSLGAALATALAVFLIFVIFSGDEPADPSPQRQAQNASAAPATPVPSAPAITLPKLPKATPLKTLPGTPSVVVGSVTDSKAAITYFRLGAPWKVASVSPFSAGQRVGGSRLPRTLAVSALLPGEKPRADLETDADFRKAAVTAVRWSVRNYHPTGSKVTWTASQRLATGKGWVLGYRVAYEIDGRKRSSQAALALIDIGQRKPAMLFVTVPDTRKQLWADIAPLVASARAL
ncbi:hypothetical protein ACFFMN_12580 [Planobispora siamensis]|uniref:hypothetical protein n=1 Tax=Planobispora siamensis TaxID=936338 RepID=UPI001951D1D4|nr:hypothetical protein [Planobispora siamensis]